MYFYFQIFKKAVTKYVGKGITIEQKLSLQSINRDWRKRNRKLEWFTTLNDS